MSSDHHKAIGILRGQVTLNAWNHSRLKKRVFQKKMINVGLKAYKLGCSQSQSNKKSGRLRTLSV
jgi:hypothetical protein